MASNEKTFSAFTSQQAAADAEGRGGSYPQPIYQHILNYHQGPKERFLDVGTGTGKVVTDLIADFKWGIGCDSSVEMIEQAKKDAALLGIAKKTKFAVCGAEHCATALVEADEPPVNLITVAMAAHWFNLPKFYASAAQALKPGGTLAMWTCSSMYCHPSVQHCKEIQAILKELEDDLLGPYMAPGNIISRTAYENLPLPWTSLRCEGLFQRKSFLRIDWDRNGVPSSAPLPDGSPGPFLFGRDITIEQAEAAFASASAVIRWREANPDQAYTDTDPVRLTMKRLREASPGSVDLTVAPSCTLLLMRRA